MTVSIELEKEADGRWIAAVAALPGVLAYGVTETDAVQSAGAGIARVGGPARA